jgi:hypothetical protein
MYFVAQSRTQFRSVAAVCAMALLACVPTFAQLPPVLDIEGAAKLINFTGRISVMHDSSAWALNAGDLVQPQQVVVTGPDGWGMFQVADGSKFEVYPNSRVVFRANRGDWKDLLEVWLGKVRVQIEHFGNLPNNNRVHTPTAVISVRGTVFDITVDDEDTTLVEDIEGSVSVRHILRPGPDRILSAGEYVRVFKNEPLGKSIIDKGGILQRVAQAARDALYQAAMNAQRGATTPGVSGGTGGGTTSSPADKNSGPPPPPSGPPPPPPPPQ